MIVIITTHRIITVARGVTVIGDGGGRVVIGKLGVIKSVIGTKSMPLYAFALLIWTANTTPWIIDTYPTEDVCGATMKALQQVVKPGVNVKCQPIGAVKTPQQ